MAEALSQDLRHFGPVLPLLEAGTPAGRLHDVNGRRREIEEMFAGLLDAEGLSPGPAHTAPRDLVELPRTLYEDLLHEEMALETAAGPDDYDERATRLKRWERVRRVMDRDVVSPNAADEPDAPARRQHWDMVMAELLLDHADGLRALDRLETDGRGHRLHLDREAYREAEEAVRILPVRMLIREHDGVLPGAPIRMVRALCPPLATLRIGHRPEPQPGAPTLGSLPSATSRGWTSPAADTAIHRTLTTLVRNAAAAGGREERRCIGLQWLVDLRMQALAELDGAIVNSAPSGRTIDVTNHPLLVSDELMAATDVGIMTALLHDLAGRPDRDLSVPLLSAESNTAFRLLLRQLVRAGSALPDPRLVDGASRHLIAHSHSLFLDAVSLRLLDTVSAEPAVLAEPGVDPNSITLDRAELARRLTTEPPRRPATAAEAQRAQALDAPVARQLRRARHLSRGGEALVPIRERLEWVVEALDERMDVTAAAHGWRPADLPLRTKGRMLARERPGREFAHRPVALYRRNIRRPTVPLRNT